MSAIIRSLGFLMMVLALMVFSGNTLAGMDDFEPAIESSWSYDEEIQEELDVDKGCSDDLEYPCQKSNVDDRGPQTPRTFYDCSFAADPDGTVQGAIP